MRQVDWSLRYHPAAAATRRHLRLADWLSPTACWRWAAANVAWMHPSWEPSPVSLLYRITAISALAAFHQPVLVHWPVDESYHRCSPTDSGRRAGAELGIRHGLSS